MRVIVRLKLPRDSGESIVAARHQDASQGPLGSDFLFPLQPPCPPPDKHPPTPRPTPESLKMCPVRPISVRFWSVSVQFGPFREASGFPNLFRFVPICSDFFRFVPRCFQNYHWAHYLGEEFGSLARFRATRLHGLCVF